MRGIWTVTYDKHLMDEWCYYREYNTRYYLKAWAIYQYLTFCYLMSPYPVKQVSIYRHDDGITFIKGRESKSQRPDELRRLKWERSRQSRFY